VYECLNGLAPAYIYVTDDCVLVSSVASRRHLRSADTRKLVVRRTRTVLGAKDLTVSCVVVWNSLPADLRTSSLTVATFAMNLKRHTCLVARTSASEDYLFCDVQMCSLLCRLLLVVLIKWVSNVPPSVRPSVRPQSFFEFN